MVEALKKLKKLRGRSFDELRVRGAQVLAAGAERRGLSAQSRVPDDAALFGRLITSRIAGDSLSDESLLEHFRTRTSPSFFASFINRTETLTELRQRFGADAGQAAIERAGRIVAGRFDLLGLRDLDFGDPVDWHLEPVAGKRTPLEHWSRIDYLNPDVAGDKKIIWELSRHQYFATLGRAYWYTGEEIYAQTFVAHLSGWMERNPPKLGINWASSLEVALRSISWLWALYFFKDAPQLTPQVFLRALKFLYLHARHLETYLSTYFSPNTHLTGEALGLFYLGTLLPEFRRARRWRELGRQILLAELDRHVRPDGVYFEQSSYYHRYTTDFYTHFLLLARANGEEVTGRVEEKLAALLDHLMYLTKPDGTTPLVGDDDGGRLMMLDERAANDFRAALSTGASLFNRADYKFVAAKAAEETLWLTGKDGLKAFDELPSSPPAVASRAFLDSGYFIMRDGWARDANYMLVDCGPHGSLNCAHAHADALAFEMAARGRTVLVDAGTCTYTGSAEMRDRFRSSQAHNTLSIDGESSSVPATAFTWAHVARSHLRVWQSQPRFDYFEGAHDGYARLASPATHARRVLFVKGDYFVMRDQVETTGAHRSELRFHFTADAAPKFETAATLESDAGPNFENDGVRAVRERACDAAGVELFAFGEGGRWRAEDGWISLCYGERAAAPVMVFEMEGVGAQDCVTFLVPRGAGDVKARVRVIEAINGRAFEMLDERSRDVLLIGDGRLIETARLRSDFAWTWARFSRETGMIDEMILIGGHHFYLDGREIFSASEFIEYAVARRVGGELQVETSAVSDLRLMIDEAEMQVVNLG